jgi:hypothetical protein
MKKPSTKIKTRNFTTLDTLSIQGPLKQMDRITLNEPHII